MALDHAAGEKLVQLSSRRKRFDKDGLGILEEKCWWVENGAKLIFDHRLMAEYIFQQHNITRFPNDDGDLYLYNPSEGIYEIDKRLRKINCVIRRLEETINKKNIAEVNAYIVDMSRITEEESKEYVAVKNGLLDIETLELREFNPEIFVTTKVPTSYNPEAHDEFVNKTLSKVSNGHKQTEKNIHEMFGAVLYPKMIVPKMFYLYGRSAHNGKSTILYMIHKTFGANGNISAISPQKLATDKFAASSIYGKIANIVDDQPDVEIEDSGLFKSIITGGYVDIEFKNQDSFSAQMRTVCITASNHYPNFREHGTQINKRLYIIPFDHNFMEDPESISEGESMRLLETESAKEYVLKLAVDGIKGMIRRTGEVLSHNDKVVEATENFAEYSNPLADFFFEFNQEYFEDRKGTDTYGDYKVWCMDNHIKHQIGLKRFKDAVCAKYHMEWKDKRIKKNDRWITVKGFKPK